MTSETLPSQSAERSLSPRAVVFLYTAPFFVALGSYRLLGERLRLSRMFCGAPRPWS